jgi:hypothetical protein
LHPPVAGHDPNASIVPHDLQAKGGSAVEKRRSNTGLPSRYDEFLFASIREEANGMRLSVLSALARMNLDPWEEATRLAAMPRVSAERTLVSTLGLASDKTCDPSEAESIAARLVRLLPRPQQQRRSVAIATRDRAAFGGQRVLYWMMLLALAMSFLSQHEARTDPGASAPAPTTSQTTSDGRSGTLSRSEPQDREMSLGR